METIYTLDHEWFRCVSDIDGENPCKTDDHSNKNDSKMDATDLKVVIIRYGLTSAYFRGASELVAIELPKIGCSLTAGEVYGTLEFSKAVFELETPLAGRVCRVNAAVLNDFQCLLTDPEGAGWLLEIECSLKDWKQWVATTT
ncbi:MAG: glycine cleavage system protein H [Thermoguttaceae bacterium]|nr:glycine cleavage system protein H [Thermoguttaceae bacterium]